MVEANSFGLFDPLQDKHLPINSEKPIVLDPTGLYSIPSGYTAITDEVEWLKFFGVSNSPCWVKGKRLCDWAQAWLEARNRDSEIAEIKQNPRLRLKALFHRQVLPSQWSDEQLLILATRLDSYPKENPIAYLLADITKSNDIWLGERSIQNLAAWLGIEVPAECKSLQKVWQNQFSEHELAKYYQTEDKLLLLRRWLGIAEPIITELGKYPLEIPDIVVEEFDQYWMQRLYNTEGKIIDEIRPSIQVGIKRIADIAYNIIKNRPSWNNIAREKIVPYLTPQQKVTLRESQPPPIAQPLTLNNTKEEVLTWVTQSYLPYRRWEIQQSEMKSRGFLAESFVDWMLEYYPQMKLYPVDNSCLNYNVTSLVKNLCKSSPVFWVVVDGLSWLDHLELLYFLTQNKQLCVETEIQPKFSILPTKTEYAKWSLYSQLLPNHSSWNNNIDNAFKKIGTGKRYTDSRKTELRQDLKAAKYNLYCWDTEQLDKLYHSEKDWKNFFEIKRPNTLKTIAEEIQSFVTEFPHPGIKVVIASDHGQILGTSEKIANCPRELDPKGRMAIGTTDDSRFVVLKKEYYDVPHDISIVKNSASVSSFNYTQDKKVVGSHGGLYPEEVVIGVSVLQTFIQRHPVLISCSGEGKANQLGELEITIHNPNSVSLTNLYLYINELPSLKDGIFLEKKIPAYQSTTFKIKIPKVPELPPTHEVNSLLLSGELTFEFSNLESGNATLTPDSKIIIHQIYSSGLNIDEFL